MGSFSEWVADDQVGFVAAKHCLKNICDCDEIGVNIRTRVSEPKFCVDTFPLTVSEL